MLIFLYLNYKNKRFNWSESLKAESEEPYGTAFIMKMLKGNTTNGTFTYNTKKQLKDVLDPEQTEQTYVLIGGYMFLDSLSLSVLTKFIENGNDAFIAAQFPQEILYKVWTNECLDSIEYPNTRNSVIKANFFHPEFASKAGYKFSYRFLDEDLDYNWNYLTSTALCDSIKTLTPLGYIETSYVNFFKIRYGKGNLFIHTNPILFSNYSMTKESSVEYASAVFSHFQNKTVIWDEFSKSPRYNLGNSLSKSPLYFIMEQRSLRYGWWLLLITTTLYIAFAAKRKQKLIPVIEPRVNTSLQFIKMISSLHYQYQNNSDMAQKKMKHFLHHVRSKYNISTHKIDDVFIKNLSLKSKVSEDEINNIFIYYRIVERIKDINLSRLVELYNHIDNFYKQEK